MHPLFVVENMRERRKREYDNLLLTTMARIHHEERLLVLKRRIIIGFVGAVGSLAAFVFAAGLTRAELAQSGVSEMLFLLFSDPQIVFSLWRDFVYSVLEQLPALSIASCLLSISAFMWSLMYLMRDIRLVQRA